MLSLPQVCTDSLYRSSTYKIDIRLWNQDFCASGHSSVCICLWRVEGRFINNRFRSGFTGAPAVSFRRHEARGRARYRGGALVG